jgi:predicted metal-dependent hydrolase
MIDYLLRRHRRYRRLSIRIDHQGRVLVNAPPLLPKLAINVFVNQQQDWIQRQLQQRSTISLPADQVQIFAQLYQLRFTYTPDLATGWRLQSPTLIYNSAHYALHPHSDPMLTASESQKLNQFLRATLLTYLQQRLPQLHQRMGLSKKIGHIRVKNQASCWGSCSSRGNLNFNFRLIHHPPAVIDYVLIHELAHFVHLNHSREFWALVAKYDGNYKLHRQSLR